MRPARRGGHDLVELPPPAQFLARAHHGPQWPFAGEPFSERPRYPSADVVEIVGGVCEVEDRVLEECAGEGSARKPRVVGAGRMVDHQARYPRHPPAGRDGDVNERRPAVGEAVQFGRGLVAQLCPLARVEHRRPQLRRTVDRAGEGRVDAAVNLLPPPEFDLRGDGARG